MLYLYTGTDREKTRAALNTAIKKESKNARVVRISDAHTLADLETSLKGGGMFEGARTVVFDGVLNNEEMRGVIIRSLDLLKKSEDTFFIIEEKPDAATRKQIEKYAQNADRYDTAAKKREGNIFALANALARRDKKTLWVALQGELAKGAAPEALHGVLFWGAKDLYIKSRAGETQNRAKKLIAMLAELPHAARRRGEELEYALERFVLSGM